MKIFLTGGTGYIGGNFINYAIKNGFTIYALTRRKIQKRKKNLVWLKGPLEKNWTEFKKCDVLIHLASEGVYKKYASFKNCYRSNVTLPSKMLHNAGKSGCLNWVIVGSCFEKKITSEKKAYKIVKKSKKIPFFNYAFSKYLFSKISLKIAKKYRANCRVLRLFHVYGKNENQGRLWPSMIAAAKKNRDFHMTKGDQLRDFCHIDNVIVSLLEATNFKIKTIKKVMIWDFATGKKKTVKKFAIELWKKYKAKGKLIFNKIKNFDDTNYIANKNRLWKIKS